MKENQLNKLDVYFFRWGWCASLRMKWSRLYSMWSFYVLISFTFNVSFLHFTSLCGFYTLKKNSFKCQNNYNRAEKGEWLYHTIYLSSMSIPVYIRLILGNSLNGLGKLYCVYSLMKSCLLWKCIHVMTNVNILYLQSQHSNVNEEDLQWLALC